MSKKMLQVPLTKFGNERCVMEIEEGSTYKDLLKDIPNHERLDIRVKGEPIDSCLNDKVSEEVTVFVAPKRIAQG